ncbi:uncharacterized protein J4E92_000423 [Alternaria infectoria]|uniref:uncharacterized protein n=1 Tax=Alternaria infectoria TaxID=45303 RepID=UPI00221F99D6|nr:uncharacterized protein J4E92_000423 [Alternaria infectoria]KAI4939140.1 hypothetical protein J4E92_000423 [Alternaria infectoria]
MTGYENSNTGGSGREPSQRAKTVSSHNSNTGRYSAPDGHGRIDQHTSASRQAVLPNFTPLTFGDIVNFWMIKHCLIDADLRMGTKDGEYGFADKCVLRFYPSKRIRDEYGQGWPHGFYMEARDGLVTAVSYDDDWPTIEILPIWTYSKTGAWKNAEETIPKSPEFCASHLSIMKRPRVNARIQYEAGIREELARNPNSTKKISRGMDCPTPNGHPYAPMDCVAVVERLHPYDPKRNSLIRFSMSITVYQDARVQRHSSLEPESRLRTRDIYRKFLNIRMLDPEERRTADYGPYTWLKALDPSYTGPLTTPEIGTINAAPPQGPTVPQQNGALPPSTSPATVATPHQMSMVPHQNAAPPRPTGTLSSTPQQVSTMPTQNGILPYPNDIINAAPPQVPAIPQQSGTMPPPPSAKRKADDTEAGSSVNAEQQAAVGNDIAKAEDDNFGAQAADSAAPLEPAQKRQKTTIGAEDKADVDVGPKPDDANRK